MNIGISLRKHLVSGLLLLSSLIIAIPTLSLAASAEEGDIEVAQSLSSAFERVAGMATPSVVNIVSVKKAQVVRGRRPSLPRDPFFENFRDFFGDNFPGLPSPNQEEPGSQGLGTGVIVDERGYILTNNHVVDGADEISVRLHDQSVYRAEIIGRDPRTDLSVIKVKAKDVAPARLGDSDNLKIGEWVVAAGNPFGLDNSITAGIVSAKGRSIMGGGQFEDFIQTDAAINPGNSGGPLLNLRGEVVGINTAIFSRSGGYMGIGFAIPINMAKAVMRDLIDKGRVIRGWLGVAIQNLSPDLSERLGYSGAEGALVGHVQKGSPSERAGIKQGDIIITLNGSRIKNVGELRNQIAATQPGKSVELGLVRDGKKSTVSVKVGELPADSDEPAENLSEENATVEGLGFSLEDMTPDLARRLRSSRNDGVVVTGVDPGGAAQQAGLQPQDIIIKVNGEPIRTVREFRSRLSSSALSDGLLLVVESQGMERFVLLKGDIDDDN